MKKLSFVCKRTSLRGWSVFRTGGLAAIVGIVLLGCMSLPMMGCMPQGSKQESSATPGAKDTAAPAAVWTCPMHPEVKQDKAGKCPKCGMDLVKSGGDAPSSGAAAPHEHESGDEHAHH
ncbi:MAG: hypothetical protein HY706_18715 [Candidatus Hydrogenedentes bacterium]|nr:hypothetical protein [Candidatus Hydrogenedentota bacterium]